MNEMFEYLGHHVVIAPQTAKRGRVRYWFIIDGHPVTFASRPDTAKRLATRFIEVTHDAYYRESRQQPVYKIGRA